MRNEIELSERLESYSSEFTSRGGNTNAVLEAGRRKTRVRAITVGTASVLVIGLIGLLGWNLLSNKAGVISLEDTAADAPTTSETQQANTGTTTTILQTIDTTSTTPQTETSNGTTPSGNEAKNSSLGGKPTDGLHGWVFPVSGTNTFFSISKNDGFAYSVDGKYVAWMSFAFPRSCYIGKADNPNTTHKLFLEDCHLYGWTTAGLWLSKVNSDLPDSLDLVTFDSQLNVTSTRNLACPITPQRCQELTISNDSKKLFFSSWTGFDDPTTPGRKVYDSSFYSADIVIEQDKLSTKNFKEIENNLSSSDHDYDFVAYNKTTGDVFYDSAGHNQDSQYRLNSYNFSTGTTKGYCPNLFIKNEGGASLTSISPNQKYALLKGNPYPELSLLNLETCAIEKLNGGVYEKPHWCTASFTNDDQILVTAHLLFLDQAYDLIPFNQETGKPDYSKMNINNTRPIKDKSSCERHYSGVPLPNQSDS